MQIQTVDQTKQLNRALDGLKEGQIQPAVIKERLSANEALISIKGKETKAVFEDRVPSNSRVLVEIKSIEKGSLTVKEAAAENKSSATHSVDDALKKAGFDPAQNKDLRQAAQLLSEKGYRLDKQTLTTVHQFLEKEGGSLEAKLSSLQAAAERKLELTPAQLRAIHSALQGKGLGTAADGLQKEIAQFFKGNSLKDSSGKSIGELRNAIQHETDRAKIVKQVLDVLKGATHLSERERNAILQALKGTNGNFDKAELLAVLGKLSQSDKGSIQSQPSVKNLELQALLKDIQKASTMDAVKASAARFLESAAKNDWKGLDDFKASMDRAWQLADKGRELSARKELMSGLMKLQEANPSLQGNQQNTLALTGEEEALIQQAVGAISHTAKDVIVTEISKRLSQLAIDFKQAKWDVIRNLDHSIKLLEYKQPQARQVLESTIKQLDQALLKSEVTLYTDMSTEKKLLAASSKLAEAKELVQRGQLANANQLVKDIKASIEPILFKPSVVKVMHMTEGVSDQESALKGWTEAIKPEASGRHMLELVRKMGYMHENEASKALLQGGKATELPANLKSGLLQLLQQDDLNPKLARQAEQTLQQLTGQQLLSKPDSSGLHTLALQLPLMLHKEVENVKVFVQSQADQEMIDWENCSLYFVMETRRLGEIGISLNASNRNLYVTFKNDRLDLAEKLTPLTEAAKERLEEIGYSIGSIQYKPMTDKAEPIEKKQEKPAKTMFGTKGYDYTI